MLQKIINFLYPPSCLVCGKNIANGFESANYQAIAKTRSSRIVCNDCNPLFQSTLALVPWSDTYCFKPKRLKEIGQRGQLPDPQIRYHCCSRCGEPMSDDGDQSTLCVPCRVWSPPTNRIRSLWQYGDQIEQVIKAFKYKKRRPLGAFLGNLLGSAIIGSENVEPIFGDCPWDVVVPLPSSQSMMQSRGFSHMSIVTKVIAKHIGVPVAVNGLNVVKNHPPQASLSTKERYDNVMESFHAVSRKVRNYKVLLVDDVITTGASIWSASWSLLDSGAKSIDVISLARSSQFGSLRLSSTSKQTAISAATDTLRKYAQNE